MQQKKVKRPGSLGNKRAVKDGGKRLIVDISLADTKLSQRRKVYENQARETLGRDPTDQEIISAAREDLYTYIDARALAE